MRRLCLVTRDGKRCNVLFDYDSRVIRVEQPPEPAQRPAPKPSTYSLGAFFAAVQTSDEALIKFLDRHEPDPALRRELLAWGRRWRKLPSEAEVYLWEIAFGKV